MGVDGIGRWDVLLPNDLTLDLEKWTVVSNKSSANGMDAPVIVLIR